MAKKTKTEFSDPAGSETMLPAMVSERSLGETGVQAPIVGIGASAGGLEALKALFTALPDNSGISFVVVTHLDPDHKSLLQEILQSYTSMAIYQIENGMLAEANIVFLIPPNRSLTISAGVLQLAPRHKSNGQNMVIDEFLISLAADQSANAACIILSGAGSDGTKGVKAIQSSFGMAIVQDETTAAFDSMPNSANKNNMADLVLSPDKMPRPLMRFFDLRQNLIGAGVESGQYQLSSKINEILRIIFSHTGHDFRRYKKNTIVRRIERRMSLAHIDTLSNYTRLLRLTPPEVSVLCKELMIGVTSFFRDPGAYRVLGSAIIPGLLANKPDDYQFRIWVPACATGEEAYSIAITVYHCIVEQQSPISIQLYATDVNADAIEMARKGIYPGSIANAVDSTLLRLYFSKLEDGNYQVRKIIRDRIVFATQDIISDPPFTRLDLAVCRNLLIYFETSLQQDILRLLHYCLNHDGILFLGSSESIGQYTDLFSVESKKWKIFKSRRKSSSTRLLSNISLRPVMKNVLPIMNPPIDDADDLAESQLLKILLLDSNPAPCVIINLANEVLYVHGRTGNYLEPAEGKTGKNNILDMVKPFLMPELSNAIKESDSFKQVVFHHEYMINGRNDSNYLRVTVKPILETAGGPRLMRVMFEEVASPVQPMARANDQNSSAITDGSIKQLEKELASAREYLRITVEELEQSNQELKSINEEMQSTNEEMQSAVEELETSKEELQSVNEESSTINAELEARVEELSTSNNDLKNLLDSTEMATIFLNTEFQIQRYTPRAVDIIPLSHVDIGRPLQNLVTSLIEVNLTDLSTQVLDTLATLERDIKTTDGRVYRLKALPYRTANNVIDGVVLSFSDVTTLQRALDELAATEAIHRGVFDIASDSIAFTDPETLEFVDFNRRAYEHLGYTREEFAKLKITDVDVKETREEVVEHLKQMAEGNRMSFDTQLTTKTGDLLTVHVESKLVQSDVRPLLLSTWFDLK